MTTLSSDSTDTQTTTSITNPGHVVYAIGNVQGDKGTTVPVPVNVYYDEGTAGFVMDFVLPDGFVISGVQLGDAYTGDNGEFLWNGDKNQLVWASNDGENQIAPNGSTIITLLVDVPADAEEDTTYPVKFGEVKAEDTDRVSLTPYTLDGSIYIKKTQSTESTTSTEATETTTQTTPVPDPGHLVLNVGDGTAVPGGTADIPVTVWFDDGSSEFTFKIDVPEGVTVENFTPDPTYAENGTFNYDPTTGTVTWTRNADSDFVPNPGQKVGTITVKVPEDAADGTEYQINLTDLSAKDKDGNPVVPTAVPGTVTVAAEVTTSSTDTTTSTTETTASSDTSETESTDTTASTSETESTDTTASTGETGESSDSTDSTTSTTETTVNSDLKVVTSYSTSFQAPTRVNYWSHDPRPFRESGGLSDLKASITLYKFYVNDDGTVVTADGTPITDANGAPLVYAEGTALPASAAFETKVKDVTAVTKPEELKDSPLEIWENEGKEQFGDAYISLDQVIGADVSDETYEAREAQEKATKHNNKYTVPCYYYPTEQDDADFMFDGQPIFFGDFKIYIGVKGDFNLDNHVDAKDATGALIYFGETTVGQRSCSLNADPELDFDVATYNERIAAGDDERQAMLTAQSKALIFYLINVMYREPVAGQPRSADGPLEDPFEIKATDAQCILSYFGDRSVTKRYETTWEDVVGYDLLDSFFGDDYQ